MALKAKKGDSWVYILPTSMVLLLWVTIRLHVGVRMCYNNVLLWPVVVGMNVHPCKLLAFIIVSWGLVTLNFFWFSLMMKTALKLVLGGGKKGSKDSKPKEGKSE